VAVSGAYPRVADRYATSTRTFLPFPEDIMKAYVITLAVGLLVGMIYGFLNVRSPAPPVIALVGLLGILIGEQVPSLVKQSWKDDIKNVSWLGHQVKPHMFGELPCGAALKKTTNTPPAGPAQDKAA
jgi:XapX domain-containing protein